MMIIANPPDKAQKAEVARFAHPPPLSYLWLLASLVYIVCRPGIRYPLTGVVYGICQTRYLRILGKTIHFFYGFALSDHKKSVALVTQESSMGVGCQPTTLPAAMRLVRGACVQLLPS